MTDSKAAAPSRWCLQDITSAEDGLHSTIGSEVLSIDKRQRTENPGLSEF